MKIRTKRIVVCIVFLLVVTLVAVALFFIGEKLNSVQTNPNSSSAIDAMNNRLRVYIDGDPYLPKQTVKNYLVIGIDEFGTVESGGVAQADFILVLSVNKSDKTYRMISINRDTMTEIAVNDVFGNKTGEVVGQIALSHTDGSNFEITNTQKCKNTVDAVSNLLYGVKFDSYISMTMDAVSILVDELGGVEVTVPHDLTAVDENLVAGNTVLLDGELAHKFIRSRGGLEDSTNIARMERQKVFLEAFLEKIKAKGFDEKQIADQYDAIWEYTVSNSGVEIFEEISEYLSTYENLGMISPEGESVIGEKYMEFYVDEEALKALVIDVFFIKEE